MGTPTMDATAQLDFATRYTAAWCSQDAVRVASFFTPTGSLTINGGVSSIGREAIAASAQGFMSAFPDLVVRLNALDEDNGAAVYRWTLSGTNSGPGGAGRRVCISGSETWRFAADGSIAESIGLFDAAEYARQVADEGPPAP